MGGIKTWLAQEDAPHINQISYIASPTLQTAYKEQRIIRWGQSKKWNEMIKHEYNQLNNKINNGKSSTQEKKKKFWTPEEWAKGLILLN